MSKNPSTYHQNIRHSSGKRHASKLTESDPACPHGNDLKKKKWKLISIEDDNHLQQSWQHGFVTLLIRARSRP